MVNDSKIQSGRGKKDDSNSKELYFISIAPGTAAGTDCLKRFIEECVVPVVWLHHVQIDK